MTSRACATTPAPSLGPFRWCNASENHLAQVIHQLAQLGYLYTQRGRKGGLSLARPPQEIAIGSVFRAIEGPVPLAECFADSDQTCPLVAVCRLRPAMTAAAEAFFAHLDALTLHDLVGDNDPLVALLCTTAEQDGCAFASA